MVVTAPEATAEVGTVTISLVLYVPVVGQEVFALVGTTIANGSATTVPVGVQANTFVGSVLIWGNIVPDQTPAWQTIAGWIMSTGAWSDTDPWADDGVWQDFDPVWSPIVPVAPALWTEIAA